MMKKIRNLTISVLALMVVITGFMYMNDFRYSKENGLYYIIDKGSNYTEEEREEKRISDDYECVLSNISDLETVVSLLKD